MKSRGVAAGKNALSTGFNTDEADIWVVEEGVEDADGVGATANASGDGVREALGLLKDLFAGFFTDDTVKVADHGRVWMCAIGCAEDVVGVADVGDPVAHGFIYGFF